MAKKFTFASKKANNHIIELSDDDDDLAQESETFKDDIHFLDDYRIGQVKNGIGLSTDDLESLDLSLNSREEYVNAMKSLDKNLKKVETSKLIDVAASPMDEPRKGKKFTFQTPKYMRNADSVLASSPSYSNSGCTPLSIQRDAKKTTFSFNYKTIDDEENDRKR